MCEKCLDIDLVGITIPTPLCVGADGANGNTKCQTQIPNPLDPLKGLRCVLNGESCIAGPLGGYYGAYWTWQIVFRSPVDGSLTYDDSAEATPGSEGW
jgi:hypothetical protein